MAVSGKDDGPAVPQAVPEECLAIEVVTRSINERWTEGDNRKSAALVHAEQRSLAHGFIADVHVGMVVRRQRITLMMIQAIAISSDARYKDVAAQPFAGKRASGRLHLRGGGAAL